MSHVAKVDTKTLEQHISASILWLDDMRSPSKWDLSQEDMCTLMGGVTRNTYKTWVSKAQKGFPIKLSEDHLTRLSLLLGIHKALSLSSPAGYEYDFFKRPVSHPMFNEKSARSTVLDDTNILNLYAVRSFFDAQRA